MAASTVPLSMVSPGDVVRIVQIRGGRGLARKLADMGLVPGTSIRVINAQGLGPVVLEARGTRLALGHGMAQRILVWR